MTDDIIKQLRQTLGKMELALGSINEAVVWTSAQGKIQWCNAVFDKLIGQVHIQILGQNLCELLTLQRNNQAIKIEDHPINKALKQKILVEDVYQIKIDDEIRYFEFSANFLLGNNDEETIVCSIHDVTKRIQSEETITEALTHLKQTHQDLKNTQKKLIQQEKLASIGQLAAGVAHEINNPMNFIGLNLQTLAEYVTSYQKIIELSQKLKKCVMEQSHEQIREVIHELTELEAEEDVNFILDDSKKLIDQSRSGVDRVRNIVKELGSFSRVKGDDAVTVNVNKVIQNVLNIVMNEIKYNADVIQNYGQVATIKGNPQRIGQVIINLLINAAQAMKDYGTIEIKTFEEGSSVIIEVSDTGSGIPKEHLKNIFDAFYTTKPVGEGTGLGLSISYEIIKQHGGEILVESAIGSGTKFKIVLPKENLKKNFKRILIIDDDRTTVAIIKEILAQTGQFEIKTVYDGFSAGQIFNDFRPDLVTLDLRMPKMDGFQVCEEIRKDLRNLHVKIIILSGLDDEEDKRRIFDLGANSFILKPINATKLLSKVNELIQF